MPCRGRCWRCDSGRSHDSDWIFNVSPPLVLAAAVQRPAGGVLAKRPTCKRSLAAAWPILAAGPPGLAPNQSRVGGTFLRVQRWAWRLALAAAICAGGSAVALRASPPAPRPDVGVSYLPVSKLAAPTAADRVLVLAPHCDDETIACGGTIAAAVRAGARVQVVIATNGDGFRVGTERMFRKTTVSPADYMRMAAVRQQESLSALAVLGLDADAVVFLGYPDRGLTPMWTDYWSPDRPFRSPYTRRDHNPYPNALRPGGVYCGQSLLRDLETVISTFQPTIVLCPHPADEHPDHRALYCYTVAALHELNLFDRVDLRLYLVHCAGWPSERAVHLRSPMLPPKALRDVGTQWAALPLTRGGAESKYAAILCYRSQLLVMRRVLTSFARGTELFGRLPALPLPLLPPARVVVDGRTSDWRGVRPIAVDPGLNRKAGALPAGGDIVAVYAGRSANSLFVRVDLAHALRQVESCRLRLRELHAGRLGPPQTYEVTLARKSKGWRCAIAGRSLELLVPLSPGLPERILLEAELREAGRPADASVWALLEVPKEGGAPAHVASGRPEQPGP